MSSSDTVTRQCIAQATCEECDGDDGTFTVTDKDMGTRDDGGYIEYEVRHTCGHEGVVTIESTGVSASDGINHDDASWNQEDEEDD